MKRNGSSGGAKSTLTIPDVPLLIRNLILAQELTKFVLKSHLAVMGLLLAVLLDDTTKVRLTEKAPQPHCLFRAISLLQSFRLDCILHPGRRGGLQPPLAPGWILPVFQAFLHLILLARLTRRRRRGRHQVQKQDLRESTRSAR